MAAVDERTKAIETALSQLEKQFGKGAVLQLGSRNALAVSVISSGAISVFQMDDPDHYRKLENFPVQKRVHSLAVDTETHRVYAPEQEADGKAVARMVVYEAVTSN